ncbi:DNA-binding domain-containing protein, partial [Klebsiella pneumoniae]|nr:DNA-binding domain-containing protein [Klebsiella pneumoniae]
RVGEEYFSQLAHLYRESHPSSHGDLHWVGQSFPEWLGQHTRGSGYEWLPDLARLEWACESSLVCAEAPPLALGKLAEVPSDRLDELRLDLQPS